MSDIQLYIDPACMLSKVPYKVPNNTHYVTLEEYEKLKAEVERLKEAWIDKKMQEDRDHLLEQVERLQKLVAMQKNIDDAIDAWIESKRDAAKEGNTPIS